MNGHRVQRVERELQSLIAEFILRRVPLPAMVSVIRVECTRELRAAKVFISVMGEDLDKEDALDTLNDQIYELQGFLNKQMKMKFAPRVRFILDDGLEKLIRVQELLDKADVKGASFEDEGSDED